MEGIHRMATASRRWQAAVAVRTSQIPMSTRGTQDPMLPGPAREAAHTVRDSATTPCRAGHPYCTNHPACAIVSAALSLFSDGFLSGDENEIAADRDLARTVGRKATDMMGPSDGFALAPTRGACSGWVCWGSSLVLPQDGLALKSAKTSAPPQRSARTGTAGDIRQSRNRSTGSIHSEQAEWLGQSRCAPAVRHILAIEMFSCL